ncbi:MAG: hypothetical protein V2A63_00265 [Patescibacteria group bacterium]
MNRKIFFTKKFFRQSGIFFLGFLLFSTPAFAWSNLGGGDHGGADWIIPVNTEVAGIHTNVGTFKINSGITATVKKYDGTNYGSFEVNANDVDIVGTIDATGAGYGGGGGGGGGGGAGTRRTAPENGGLGGLGSSGGAEGADGDPGLWGEWSPGNGGLGGLGGGVSGGLSGAGGLNSYFSIGDSRGYGMPGGLGGAGGYFGIGINSDATTDESVLVGSGGGGGGGGGSSRGDDDDNYFCTGDSGGGGGAGNRGGGLVKLITQGSLSLSGSINTKGLTSLTGNGGVGAYDGNASPNRGGTGGDATVAGTSQPGAGGTRKYCRAGYVTYSGIGGLGGAGSGGGVLLKGRVVSVSGTVDTRGGGNVTTNGGTLKVFSCSEPTYTGTKSYLGRYFAQQRTDCFLDIGLRIYDGGSIIKIAAEPGVAISPLHVFKNGTVYGIMLVAISDPNASKIRIQTASGVKALRTF